MNFLGYLFFQDIKQETKHPRFFWLLCIKLWQSNRFVSESWNKCLSGSSYVPKKVFLMMKSMLPSSAPVGKSSSSCTGTDIALLSLSESVLLSLLITHPLGKVHWQCSKSTIAIESRSRYILNKSQPYFPQREGCIQQDWIKKFMLYVICALVPVSIVVTIFSKIKLL